MPSSSCLCKIHTVILNEFHNIEDRASRCSICTPLPNLKDDGGEAVLSPARIHLGLNVTYVKNISKYGYDYS